MLHHVPEQLIVDRRWVLVAAVSVEVVHEHQGHLPLTVDFSRTLEVTSKTFKF